jgi:hypothetical protein
MVEAELRVPAVVAACPPFLVPTIGLLFPPLSIRNDEASSFFVLVGVIGIPDPAANAVEADPCDCDELIILLFV